MILRYITADPDFSSPAARFPGRFSPEMSGDNPEIKAWRALVKLQRSCKKYQFRVRDIVSKYFKCLSSDSEGRNVREGGGTYTGNVLSYTRITD